MHFMWLNTILSTQDIWNIKEFVVCHSACLSLCTTRSARSSGMSALPSLISLKLAFVLSCCAPALASRVAWPRAAALWAKGRFEESTACT